jgi:hypothetical protein
MKPLDDAPDDDARPRHPGGRPRKELDAEGLRMAGVLAGFFCNADETASVLGMTRGTLDARLREHGFAGYRAFSKKHRAAALAHLRLLQWQSAERGDAVALIWLGRQWLHQRDAPRVVEATIAGPVEPGADGAFLATIIAAVASRHGDAAPAPAPVIRHRRADSPGFDPGDNDV